MFNIMQHYLRWRRNQSRKLIRHDLQALEQKHVDSSTWAASLKMNAQLLNMIEPELIVLKPADYNDVSIHTGFINVVHLFDWTKVIIQALRQREDITFEMTNIMYRRKSVKLADFLLTSEMRRYPVDALYNNLLTELTTMLHLFDDIKDPRYADKSSAALQPAWVDVFAIVEMLCTLGARNE